MSFYKDFTLGILGGGQLGRMLIQSAVDFNIHTKVLDPDAHAPCHSCADQFVQGSLTDFDTVYNFGKTVDLLTIEIENVNVEALEKLSAEGVQVFPQPSVIKTIQDKGLQKLFYKEHNIPTGHFVLCDNRAAVSLYKGSFPVVQKLRRAGYDGRGVCVLRTKDDLEKAFDAPSVLEEFVEIATEISVIVARSVTSAVQVFLPAEMVFHVDANMVDFLIAPARISSNITAQAQQIAVRVAESLGIVGLLAVEMFITKDGRVLVNESAPRPHNSGHHTIEANVTSQFEQHLRAILGLPLGSTVTNTPAVMVNLVGEKGHEGPAQYQGIEEVFALSGAHVHLYGKALTKPFRKMGHVTIVDQDLTKALEKAMIVQKSLKIIA